MEEKVVLVDDNDVVLGEMDKMEAHEKALLHRAVSVFILNSKQELLIHQRAACKYHSPLLWTNAACTHPRLNETPMAAAQRRLKEEMGMEAVLKKVLDFVYKAELDRGLTEHEFDHVFVGITDEKPSVNPEEVASYKYVPLEAIAGLVEEHPEHYTEWFKIVLERVLAEL